MRDLRETLDEHREEYLKYLTDLVAIDTHCLGHGIAGGLEKGGQDYMMRLFREMGADEITEDPMEESVILECLEKHQEGNPGHNQENRSNVYAVFRGKKGGRSILFNGHIDVMPAEDSDGWTTPPYAPDVRDGKVFGRGTADMKGGLMASVMAVKLLQDAGYTLPGDVIITSVCDEEGGGNGSMQAVMRGLSADGVVNCEGTDDELILAHMGWVFFRVEFEGKACHSGGKANGVSAIDKAIKVIHALEEKEHAWLLTYKHPLLPPPNLNIGVIKGGSAGSTVPGDCMFETCVHFVPGLMTMDQVKEEFIDAVTRCAKADPWMESHMPKITVYQAGQGFEQDPEDPFIQAFRRAFLAVRGKEAVMAGCPAGNDARLFKNIARCPVVLYGPGHLAQCHGVDEYLELEEYYNAILTYAQLILEFSGEA
ncbi:MAG: ArgE/DapE family deacylase [Clostridium sp.]|nr:ArgE/DapE family deacylase [Clostridium sp.]